MDIKIALADSFLRWYAIKAFERDKKVPEELNLDRDLKARLEQHIVGCEKELDDDAESIITNRILALPVFAVIMFCIYAVAMGASVADGGAGRR